jgi:hypothetical protein
VGWSVDVVGMSAKSWHVGQELTDPQGEMAMVGFGVDSLWAYVEDEL